MIKRVFEWFVNYIICFDILLVRNVSPMEFTNQLDESLKKTFTAAKLVYKTSPF